MKESRLMQKPSCLIQGGLFAALLATMAFAAGPVATFSPATHYFLSDTSGTENGTSPSSIALGDMDGDGDLDCVTANGYSDNVSILLGDGSGNLGGARGYSINPADFGVHDVGDAPADVAVADFNGDGRLDVVTANFASDDVSVLLGDGAGALGTPTTHNTSGSATGVVAADFDGDGDADIATADFYADKVSILLNDGVGGFGSATSIAITSSGSKYPFRLAAAYINGDAHLDLVTGNTLSDSASLLLGDGTGSFSYVTDIAMGSAPYGITVADFNGDGLNDLVTANVATSDITVRLNTGTGFGAAGTYPAGAGTEPRGITTGDFNKDGRADLATANPPTDNVSVLLGAPGGFGPTSRFAVGDWAEAVAAGDLNGDGRDDLVSANNLSSTVSVLLSIEDTRAPTCLTGTPVTERNDQGQIKRVFLPVDLSDDASGIQMVKLTARSFNVYLEGPNGETSEDNTLVFEPAQHQLTVKAVKRDLSKRARVELEVVDHTGKRTVCDPVITTLVIPKGQRRITRSFKGIPHHEHYITFHNGAPGLKKYRVMVNGKLAAQGALAASQKLTLDVQHLMRPGTANNIRVTVAGPSGAEAMLLIGDASLAGGSHPARGANAEFSR